jgi:hypothetical protein
MGRGVAIIPRWFFVCCRWPATASAKSSGHVGGTVPRRAGRSFLESVRMAGGALSYPLPTLPCPYAAEPRRLHGGMGCFAAMVTRTAL